MPVLKAKDSNGVWYEVAGVSGHKHTMSEVTDFPSNVPADVESLKEKVGESSVADQIAAAVEHKANVIHTHSDLELYNTVTGYGEVDIVAADTGTNMTVKLSSDTYSDFSNIRVDLTGDGEFSSATAEQDGTVNGLIAISKFTLSLSSGTSGFDASKVLISCTYLIDVGDALNNYVLNVDEALEEEYGDGSSSAYHVILVDDSLSITGAAADAKATGNAIKVVRDKVNGLSKVATSGDYNDLINKPEFTGGGSVEQVQADWNQSDDTQVDFIKNKPTIPETYTHPSTHPASMITGLATVATSGDYNDLINKPEFTGGSNITVSDTYDATSSDAMSGKAVAEALQTVSAETTEQVQVDWNQTDDTAVDYIKNKPEIPEEYVHPETHPASMITGLSDVAISGSYNDLTDLPEEYAHPESHPATMITGLATVATSGSYNDLSNKPTIPSIDGLATKTYVDEQIATVSGSGGSGGITEQVQPDWDETDIASSTYIKNKPFHEKKYSSQYSFETIPTVTFDGAGYTWWKCSDLVLTKEQILKTSILTTFAPEYSYDEVPQETDIVVDEENFTGVLFASGSNAGYIFCRATGENTVNFAGSSVAFNCPEMGVYIACSVGQTPPTTVCVDIDYSEIKTLDAKYLPMDAIEEEIKEPIPTAIDLSGYESEGKIIETFADGSTETTTMTFDSEGRPSTITDKNGNVTTLTW